MTHVVCAGDLTNTFDGVNYVASCSVPFVVTGVGIESVDVEVAAQAFVAGFAIVFGFWALGKCVGVVLSLVRR